MVAVVRGEGGGLGDRVGVYHGLDACTDLCFTVDAGSGCYEGWGQRLRGLDFLFRFFAAAFFLLVRNCVYIGS